jgi:glycerophosphoryl diester phosphodiesterase
LEADALIVEVDITPLSAGDFALLHDGVLDFATNGTGSIFSTTAEQVRRLKYTYQGSETDETVGLLSQAVSLIRDHTSLQELQLDLKSYAPLSHDVLNDLLYIIEPVKDRIRVTSNADWALRHLSVLDSDLLLGFDPQLYLDAATAEDHNEIYPPFRIGAYGYRDDHPLSSRSWGSPMDYLEARAEALIAQSPPDLIWYIDMHLLAKSLDDGFDWIAHLHERGYQVDVWTLDPNHHEQMTLARRLVDAGIDRITTNDAPSLAIALGDSVEF